MRGKLTRISLLGMLILSVAFLATNGPVKGTGWCYFSGTPTYVPNIEYECELAWDFVNKKAYYWDRIDSTWKDYKLLMNSRSGVENLFLTSDSTIILEDNGKLETRVFVDDVPVGDSLTTVILPFANEGMKNNMLAIYVHFHKLDEYIDIQAANGQEIGGYHEVHSNKLVYREYDVFRFTWNGTEWRINRSRNTN